MAVQTELTVRIEGKEKTLFEGPILTEGHEVRATSDTESHPCDGTNNGAHAEAMPTPTAAAADAMELTGQTWDAAWFPGFDDYYINQFGPDHEDLTAFQYWGVLANGVFTPVGGCQYGDRAGDEVLWAYDAFSGRRFLWLAAETDPTVAPRTPLPTAYVEVGQPLRLLVDSYEGGGDEPQRTEGITVAPVETDPVDGDETVDVGSPEAVTSNSEGSAEMTFTTPGWHRIKAQKEAGYIRSDRLDVCVEPEGGGSCGPLPADARLRVPPRSQATETHEAPVEAKGVVTTTADQVAATEKPVEAKPTPSNAVFFGTAVGNLRKGRVRVDVSVPGAGTLSLRGPQVIGESRATSGAGIVLLTVQPTAKARKALREKGKVRVGVDVAFTPSGGATATAHRAVTLRLGATKR